MVNELREANHPSELIRSPELLSGLREELRTSGVAVTRNFLGDSHISQVMAGVEEIVDSADYGWRPLTRSSQNFWWINDNNDLSTVRGAFLQVNFFPWDTRSQRFFELFSDVFRVRNLLLGQERDAYMSPGLDDEITVRIAAQYYPSNYGWMQEHQDPEGPHQTVLASLVMSEFGTDYEEGGLFSRLPNGEKIFPEKNLNPGDLIWFTPSLRHGVEQIVDSRLSGFQGWDNLQQGRWMLLIASNSLKPDSAIARAVPVVS